MDIRISGYPDEGDVRIRGGTSTATEVTDDDETEDNLTPRANVVMNSTSNTKTSNNEKNEQNSKNLNYNSIEIINQLKKDNFDLEFRLQQAGLYFNLFWILLLCFDCYLMHLTLQ
jgi:hypothetical protein